MQSHHYSPLDWLAGNLARHSQARSNHEMKWHRSQLRRRRGKPWETYSGYYASLSKMLRILTKFIKRILTRQLRVSNWFPTKCVDVRNYREMIDTHYFRPFPTFNVLIAFRSKQSHEPEGLLELIPKFIKIQIRKMYEPKTGLTYKNRPAICV